MPNQYQNIAKSSLWIPKKYKNKMAPHKFNRSMLIILIMCDTQMVNYVPILFKWLLEISHKL